MMEPQEIKDVIRNNYPLTVKKLIRLCKSCLGSKEKRMLFTENVKRIARLIENPSDPNEKIIELKIEYQDGQHFSSCLEDSISSCFEDSMFGDPPFTISVPEVQCDASAPHSSGMKRKLDPMAAKTRLVQLSDLKRDNPLDGTIFRRQLVAKKSFFEGNAGFVRKVREQHPCGATSFFEGGCGSERKVRDDFPSGDKSFFEGDAGSERKVRDEFCCGLNYYYEGGPRYERLVLSENPDAVKSFFEGVRGSERKVREQKLCGATSFFEGEAGTERKVREEYPSGHKSFFAGVRKRCGRAYSCPGGKKSFYEGLRGSERLVREEYVDGERWFYEGEHGSERRVRVEYSDGRKYFFKSERLVREELHSGEKSFFEGDTESERLVRTEYPDGRKSFFEGEADCERKVREEKKNETSFFDGERGQERLVRVEKTEFYTGATGCEKSVDSLCCVCLDAEKDVAFTPCGHVCICRSCLTKLPIVQQSKCPICKGNGSTLRVYY